MRKINDGLTNSQRYNLRHPDRRNAITKKWQMKNKEYFTKWESEHREERRERHRQQYRLNPVPKIATVRKSQRKIKSRYRISRWMAMRRNLEWSIAYPEYCELVSQRCFYRNHPNTSQAVGLDRKDNSRGYTISNTVSCCGNCNRIKCHLLSHEEMIAVGRALDEFVIKKALEGVHIGH